MAKLVLVILLFSLGMAMPLLHGIVEDDDEWFQNLHYAKHKVTRLHFYLHDTLSGKDPSSVQVAQASSTKKSPTIFGAVFIVDDPLTESPEPTSRPVGRAQGLEGSAGQQELGLLVAMNFVFTTGKFNGSSLTILGRNTALHPPSEMPIIGGTGVCRLARGFVIANTHSLNVTSGNGILEYSVVAIHY